jgi:hypothetical protein
LCCAVNGGNFILLLHEGASVERLQLVCDADDAFSLRHDLSSKKRPCLAWPSATVGCKDLEYRAPKVVNFSPQPHNSLSFYWNVDDRHILLQRLIGGSIGVFELDAILTGRAWIRIEKCITNIAEGKIFRPWRRSVAWLWRTSQQPIDDSTHAATASGCRLPADQQTASASAAPTSDLRRRARITASTRPPPAANRTHGIERSAPAR